MTSTRTWARRAALVLSLIFVVAANVACPKAYSGCTQNGFFDADDPPGVACSLNYSCSSGEIDLRLSCADADAAGTHVCSCFENGDEIGTFEDNGICDDVDGAKARFEEGCAVQVYEGLGIFTVASYR